MAGDLEDVVCSVAWPLFCFLCGFPSPLSLRHPSSSVVLAASLAVTFVCVLALVFVVVIGLPETLLELARVVSMAGLTVLE